MKTISTLIILLLLVSSTTNHKNWYTVKFHSLCTELERDVTPERSAKFGNMTAYNIRQDSVAVDTVRVSFDFLSNCCETFASKASIVNDTLRLEYYKTSKETCRCLCDYRFVYAVTDSTKTWSGIKISRTGKKK